MTEASPTCLAGAADRLGLTGTVDAVCVVHQLIDDHAGSVGVSGIDKRPVSGPVRVRPLGLHGDVQADRKHHGGTEKAVYAYAAEDAQWWAAELGRELPAGSFGENLRLSGIDLDGAHPGERWQIGDQLVLEATVPRIPCATFGRWLDQPGWVKRFLAAGRPGTYFKVITPGKVQAGDRAAVIAVAEAPGTSIRETAWRYGPERARPND
ncbi:molybdenum cofactor sulfurase [Nesterenkonia sp. AN1]|uniref:MOSC domain-containing protein YiiM n=1 Tax=Nesterenkonia aurantiaca TaxID=1436010 RepID=A0A4R7G306_9MICC|nr:MULTISPECIES: MOSC domain-containing protein [Nesterenkonia]EXF26121.1 molybdenum cofactor sulfurase [Nesterenkonia sp. AN1]TDS85470.1 MOSC domain-containing protein YiiM [Nesterenkonia aurantiaca]